MFPDPETIAGNDDANWLSPNSEAAVLFWLEKRQGKKEITALAWNFFHHVVGIKKDADMEEVAKTKWNDDRSTMIWYFLTEFPWPRKICQI